MFSQYNVPPQAQNHRILGILNWGGANPRPVQDQIKLHAGLKNVNPYPLIRLKLKQLLRRLTKTILLPANGLYKN